MSVTIPEDTESVSVYLLLRNATGTAYFDGLQLESGSSRNSYNMLENSSFEQVSDGQPEGWNLENTGTEDGSSKGHYWNGAYSLKLKGEASKNKYVYQEVAVDSPESEVYMFSGWALADAVPDTKKTQRQFDLFARIYYSDGTSEFKTKQGEFNREVPGWQRASMVFDLSDGDSKTTKTVTKIRVGMRYYKQANAAYFDHMQLKKDVTNLYTYDSEGNLITAKEKGEKTSALNYDDQSNLTSVRDAEDNLYEYEYNDAHQVTKATTPLKQTITYHYKSNGTVNSTVISNPKGTKKIKTGTIYSSETNGISAGAYVTKTRDQNGNDTTYDYNVKTGNLKSVQTPDQVTTSYRYNAKNDQLQQVTSGDTSVTYTYDASNTSLEAITCHSGTYQFAYDTYGNVVTTKVGEQTLSTNTYAANNGKLIKNTYGNGDERSYTYTKAGNLATEKINGVRTAGWTYDAAQQLAIYRDYQNQEKHVYDYDDSGRVLEEKVTAFTDSDVEKRYATLYVYDALNRVKKQQVAVQGRTNTATYQYNKNGQPSKLSISGSRTLEYQYDTLGRLSTKTLSLDTPLKYRYTYRRSGRDETNTDSSFKYTTTQLYKEALGTRGYYYSYDSMGNIISIKEGIQTEESSALTEVEEKVTYCYDSQNQLSRENNLCSNVLSNDAGRCGL